MDLEQIAKTNHLFFPIQLKKKILFSTTILTYKVKFHHPPTPPLSLSLMLTLYSYIHNSFSLFSLSHSITDSLRWYRRFQPQLLVTFFKNKLLK